MRTEPDKGLVSVNATLGRSEGAVPLGRLGNGLAQLYRDVIAAPLPADLQSLADRLQASSEGREPGESSTD